MGHRPGWWSTLTADQRQAVSLGGSAAAVALVGPRWSAWPGRHRAVAADPGRRPAARPMGRGPRAGNWAVANSTVLSRPARWRPTVTVLPGMRPSSCADEVAQRCHRLALHRHDHVAGSQHRWRAGPLGSPPARPRRRRARWQGRPWPPAPRSSCAARGRRRGGRGPAASHARAGTPSPGRRRGHDPAGHVAAARRPARRGRPRRRRPRAGRWPRSRWGARPGRSSRR